MRAGEGRGLRRHVLPLVLGSALGSESRDRRDRLREVGVRVSFRVRVGVRVRVRVTPGWASALARNSPVSTLGLRQGLLWVRVMGYGLWVSFRVGVPVGVNHATAIATDTSHISR